MRWLPMLIVVLVTMPGCGPLEKGAAHTDEAVRTVHSSPYVPSGKRLRVAARAIASAADQRGWALSAVGPRPDMTGLTVEVADDRAMPSFERDIRALVKVPVTFRYGGGPPIERPVSAGAN